MSVAPAPIPIVAESKSNKSVVLNQLVLAYSPKSSIDLTDPKPGTKTPRAKRAPAKIKLRKLGLENQQSLARRALA